MIKFQVENSKSLLEPLLQDHGYLNNLSLIWIVSVLSFTHVSFSVGARHSIDSTVMSDYRPTDLQIGILTSPSTSEVVMLPSNLTSEAQQQQPSSLHHPHHRHHRPFPLSKSGSSHSSMFTDIPWKVSDLEWPRVTSNLCQHNGSNLLL